MPVAETETELGGHRYRIGRLSPMVQLHILRRMGAPLVTVMDAYMNERATPGQLMVPIMLAMGKLSDPDTEYIIYSALSVVHRHQPGTEAWAPVLSPSKDGLMFMDINMMTMTELAFRVIEVQLDDFFPKRPPEVSPVPPVPGANGQVSPEARI